MHFIYVCNPINVKGSICLTRNPQKLSIHSVILGVSLSWGLFYTDFLQKNNRLDIFLYQKDLSKSLFMSMCHQFSKTVIKRPLIGWLSNGKLSL